MIPSLALFAMSPIYIFVSRLFMIESTALFLSFVRRSDVPAGIGLDHEQRETKM